MVQILTSRVSFHLMTEAYHIASVQKVLQVVNHGALQRLMREDITRMANGDIVAATVVQVTVGFLGTRKIVLMKIRTIRGICMI